MFVSLFADRFHIASVLPGPTGEANDSQHCNLACMASQTTEVIMQPVINKSIEQNYSADQDERRFF